MSKQGRKHFTPEFRLEVAPLVVDKNYSVREASELMNVGKSTVDKWARQLKLERDGGSPLASPMTPDQIKIRELEIRIKDIEEEKEILKKATEISSGQRNITVNNITGC